MRTCYTCKTTKEENEFYKDHNQCISCQKKYYKAWYKKNGRKRRQKKNYEQRNKRIVEMYDNPPRGHYTFQSVANIFQISESEVTKIYKSEKIKMQIVKLRDEDGYMFVKIAEILTKGGEKINEAVVRSIYHREKTMQAIRKRRISKTII